MRGRFKIANLPRTQSWTDSCLALSAASAAAAAGFSKTFLPSKGADSPKLIHTNSTPASLRHLIDTASSVPGDSRIAIGKTLGEGNIYDVHLCDPESGS